jgi:hypothetical protein
MGTTSLTCEQIEKVLSVTFPNIKVTLEDDEFVLGYTGATVAPVEMEVTRHSILGSKTEAVKGWQGFVSVTSGGYGWDPPDVDVVDLTEPFESLVAAITAVAGALVMSAIGDALGDVLMAQTLSEEVPF